MERGDATRTGPDPDPGPAEQRGLREGAEGGGIGIGEPGRRVLGGGEYGRGEGRGVGRQEKGEGAEEGGRGYGVDRSGNRGEEGGDVGRGWPPPWRRIRICVQRY